MSQQTDHKQDEAKSTTADSQAVATSDEHGDVLTGHVYDDIQEYDNPTPGWWNWLFIASIVYAVLYLMIYELGTAPGIHSQYETAFANNLKVQFAEIGELSADRATIVQYMNDPEWIKVGELTYKGNCASCHGANGEGLVGPNLTDDHYKNVDEIEDIATVIAEGAANGAMPAWQNRLHPNEVVLTAAYVANLRGTDPGGAQRKAEGEVIPPWPTSVATVEEEQGEEEVEGGGGGGEPGSGEATSGDTND